MAAINQIDLTTASSNNPNQLIVFSRPKTPLPSKEFSPVSESENQNGKEYTGSSNKKLGVDELPIIRDLENNRKFLISKLTPFYGEISQTGDLSRQKEEAFDVQNVFADKSSTNQQITQPLRDYKRKEILHQAVLYFNDFRDSLNTSEAAMHIHLAKKKLEESWNFIAHEDREIGMMISAVEDSIRQLKWRDYKPYQVEIIRDILQDCVDDKIKSQKDVLDRTSKLFKHDIDIFPSAPDEAYEEND
jgi:hypothetical protein